MPKPPKAHWRFHEAIGLAEEHHHRVLPSERAVWDFEITRPALVLGSRQNDSIVDLEACATRGIDVVTRRSGGGLMLLIPGEHLWLDVVICPGDPLWSDDVQTSMNWLGAIWQRALADSGITNSTVATGGLVADELGQLVCFAGRGPGEVMGSDGRMKYVGISQRRNREQARFQCTAYTKWDADLLLALLSEPVADPERLRTMVGVVPVAPLVLAARVFELISELD
ncbi:MAG: lipoyl protein ligase domain-containing protein [Ilumatobacteraceae bacterium]